MHKTIAVLAGAIALASAQAATAFANAWPQDTDTVHIVVPAAGNATPGHTIAHLLTQRLQAKLGGHFVIDTHAGASGNAGVAMVADAKPDGSTFLLAWTDTLAVNPSLFTALPFDPQSSFDAIGLIAEIPVVLAVNNKLPALNLWQFTRYVDKNPGVVNFGSTGKGSTTHLAGQLYMSATGANMVHVPYRSGEQASSDLMSGEIQSIFQLVSGILPNIQANLIRAVGVMAHERSDALPDVPTMAEQGRPELVSSTWFALMAPKGTPADIVQRMNKALNEILLEPEVKQKLLTLGAKALGGPPQDVDQRLAHDLTKWKKVVTEADVNIR